MKVQFKVATKAFLLGYSAAANTAVGDHVLVSVEGGEDLGVVAQLITMREYLRLKALQILPGTSKYKFDNCMGRILRLATADEKGSLIQKACDEQEILEVRRFDSERFRTILKTYSCTKCHLSLVIAVLPGTQPDQVPATSTDCRGGIPV